MRKYIFLLIATFTLLFTVGCLNKKNDDYDKLPPIIDDETDDGDEFEQEENDGKEEDDTYMELKGLGYYSYLNKNNPQVTFETSEGTLVVELFPSVAENTVNNFLSYATNKDYVGSIFHRVIETFMIQGGAVTNTKRPIKGDFKDNGVVNNLLHTRGVLSMARTMVNNSATSQFFIMHQDSPHLDGAYAGFGGLISGFDVLDNIATTRTDYNDRPVVDIVITDVIVSLNGYVPKPVVYA